MLRSSIVEGSNSDPPAVNGPSNDVTNDFLVPGCICAIAATEKSTNTVCFVKILESREANQPYTDDYSFTVAKCQEVFCVFATSWQDMTQNSFSRNEENYVSLQDQCCLSFCYL